MFTIRKKAGRGSLFFIVMQFILFFSAGRDAKADPVVFFPQITVDSRQGPGQNLFTTQGFHYTAGVGWAGSAVALSITFDGVTHIPLVNGTLDARAAFISSSVDGNVVSGFFQSPGLPFPDLVLADVSGVLLSGPYHRRAVSGAFGATTGESIGTWQVTGGSLAPLFFLATGGNAHFNYDLFSISPAFSPNSFSENFDGHLAGIIAPEPVPEPATLLLLGTALAGVAIKMRKRLNNRKSG